MSASKTPKVFLFDIGGVCVRSPFQAILDYELSLGIPPGWVNFSISRTAPNGFWHKMERGDIPMDRVFFDGFNEDLHNPSLWSEFYQREQKRNPGLLPPEVPPLPRMDGEALFIEMMTASDFPDPWMFPALQNLRKSGKFILAALSNTVIFPPGHKLHEPDFFSGPVRGLFDVFVSSAHVGMRKPEPRIYELARQKVDEFARAHAGTPRAQGLGWSEGIKASEMVFLDDIGQNLREARIQGMGTVKVSLGKAYEAVDELEKITGLSLAGDHPRIPDKPKPSPIKPRI